MRAQISQGRMLSADPKEDARDSYAQGLLIWRPELGRLIDRRTPSPACDRIASSGGRFRVASQGHRLVEDADQMKVASKALEEALSEALAFAVESMPSSARAQKLAID